MLRSQVRTYPHPGDGVDIRRRGTHGLWQDQNSDDGWACCAHARGRHARGLGACRGGLPGSILRRTGLLSPLLPAGLLWWLLWPPILSAALRRRRGCGWPDWWARAWRACHVLGLCRAVLCWAPLCGHTRLRLWIGLHHHQDALRG